MAHQHSETNTRPAHTITIRNKLFAGFLQHMHDTELWASHLPRVPRGLYLLAIVGVAFGAASFTSLMPDSNPFKLSALVTGILLILPAIFAYRFARRKWKYASTIREHIFEAIAL